MGEGEVVVGGGDKIWRGGRDAMNTKGENELN